MQLDDVHCYLKELDPDVRLWGVGIRAKEVKLFDTLPIIYLIGILSLVEEDQNDLCQNESDTVPCETWFELQTSQ